MQIRFYWLSLVIIVVAPSSSVARDDPSTKPLTSIIAPILDILKARPEAASDACIESLRELHQTQKAFDSGRYDDSPSDYAIAHDVLESDLENSIQVCGADARRLCLEGGINDAVFKARCTRMIRQHPG